MYNRKMYNQDDYNSRKQRAKAVPIESYLSSKGFYPSNTNRANNRLNYKHNPIDNTLTNGKPNFSVYINSKMSGRGELDIFKDMKSHHTGNVIDLAMLLNDSNFRAAIDDILDFRLTGKCVSPIVKKPTAVKGSGVLKFSYEMPINSKKAQSYISKRMLDIDIVKRYVKMVNYSGDNYTGYGLGWKNDSDGYTIRYVSSEYESPYRVIGKNDATTLKADYLPCRRVTVFESMFDFLSMETALKGKSNQLQTVAKVLNGVGNVRALNLSGFDVVFLAVDNDSAGDDVKEYIEKKHPSKTIIDIRYLYDGYKDANTALVKGALRVSA